MESFLRGYKIFLVPKFTRHRRIVESKTTFNKFRLSRFRTRFWRRKHEVNEDRPFYRNYSLPTHLYTRSFTPVIVTPCAQLACAKLVRGVNLRGPRRTRAAGANDFICYRPRRKGGGRFSLLLPLLARWCKNIESFFGLAYTAL